MSDSMKGFVWEVLAAVSFFAVMLVLFVYDWEMI